MITQDQARQHARIDGTDDAEIVDLLVKAAVQHCVAYLNRPVYEDKNAQEVAEKNKGERGGIVVTDDIRAAMLLTFGYLYQNREDVGIQGNNGRQSGALPQNACWLMDKYRHCPGV